MSDNLTPTQLRILELLSDGRPHTRREMHACLDDDLAQPTAFERHLTGMRKILRPKGEDILCQRCRNGQDSYYVLVRLLASPYRE